jgi:translation elongation factor EF-1beta
VEEHKLVDVAYGIKKIRLGMIIEDSKVFTLKTIF